MFIDPDGMGSGADSSYRASWLAMEGKQKLRRATINAGIFGDFAEADGFHSGISGTLTQHVAHLRDHEATLGTLGDRVRLAAASFVEMEGRNRRALEILE